MCVCVCVTPEPQYIHYYYMHCLSHMLTEARCVGGPFAAGGGRVTATAYSDAGGFQGSVTTKNVDFWVWYHILRISHFNGLV